MKKLHILFSLLLFTTLASALNPIQSLYYANGRDKDTSRDVQSSNTDSFYKYLGQRYQEQANAVIDIPLSSFSDSYDNYILRTMIREKAQAEMDAKITKFFLFMFFYVCVGASMYIYNQKRGTEFEGWALSIAWWCFTLTFVLYNLFNFFN